MNRQKMRILLLFNHYRTLMERGGLRSYQIGTYLSKKGYEITAIVPGIDSLSEKKHKSLKGRLYAREKNEGVTLLRVNSIKNKRNSKPFRVLYYFTSSLMQILIALSGKKHDVIICNSLPLTQLLFAFVLSKISKIPLVVDIRDLPLDTAIEISYLKKNILIRALMNLELFLFKKADVLIVVSKGFKRILIKKGVSADKIYFVPIGYDKNNYEKKIDWNRNIRKELGLDGKLVVLYAGTMGYVTDIMTILKAASLTVDKENIVYLFAGGGQREREYRKLADEKKLNTIFLGQVPKSDVILLSKSADFCAYALPNGPLISSLLGNKVFDHLGTGCPMIYCGPTGDISCIVKISGGGICLPSKDSKGLAREILYLYKNPDKINNMSKNGGKYIQSNYLTKNMMDELEKIILNIMKRY